MAVLNYLISGLPGTGKTSVCKELQSRGFHAVDADTLASQDANKWLWNDDKMQKVLADTSHQVSFICGSASNRDLYIHQFAKVFILYVDDQILTSRLTNRKNNNFGKSPEVLARQLKLNQGVREYSLKRGRILIDASRPLKQVVDMIISLSMKD